MDKKKDQHKKKNSKKGQKGNAKKVSPKYELNEEAIKFNPFTILDHYSFLEILSYLSLVELLVIRRVNKEWKDKVETSLRTLRVLHFCTRYKQPMMARDNRRSRGRLYPNEQIINDYVTERSSFAPYESMAFQIIFTLCPNITSLNVSNMTLKFEYFASCLGEHFSHLIKINLTDCRGIKPKNVIHLSKNCPNIMDLDLTGQPLDDGSLSPVFFGLKQLQNLSLLGVSNLSGECLLNLSTKIRQINLKYCPNLNDAIFQQFLSTNGSRINDMRIGGLFPSLQPAITERLLQIICNSLDYTLMNLNIESHRFQSMHNVNFGLIGKFKLLQKLYIDVPISDEKLIDIISGCRQLLHLEICFAQRISDKSLTLLPKCIPNLEIFKILFVWITDKTLEAITEMKMLQTLDVNLAGYVSVNALIKVIEKCKKLKNIRLCNCFRSYEVHLIIEKFKEVALTRKNNLINVQLFPVRVINLVDLPKNLKITYGKLPNTINGKPFSI